MAVDSPGVRHMLHGGVERVGVLHTATHYGGAVRLQSVQLGRRGRRWYEHRGGHADGCSRIGVREPCVATRGPHNADRRVKLPPFGRAQDAVERPPGLERPRVLHQLQLEAASPREPIVSGLGLMDGSTAHATPDTRGGFDDVLSLHRNNLASRRHVGWARPRPRWSPRRRRSSSQPQLRTYRQATTRGVSSGLPASMLRARRMNCACVHTSGVAENVFSPGRNGGLLPGPAGALWSQTCSARKCVESSAERPMVFRYRWAPRPRARRYSPRSPVSSGHPRPRVSREPVGTGSHWVPSGRSPYPSKLARCQNGPLAVGNRSSRSITGSVDSTFGSVGDFTPRRTTSRKLGSTTRR